MDSRFEYVKGDDMSHPTYEERIQARDEAMANYWEYHVNDFVKRVLNGLLSQKFEREIVNTFAIEHYGKLIPHTNLSMGKEEEFFSWQYQALDISIIEKQEQLERVLRQVLLQRGICLEDFTPWKIGPKDYIIISFSIRIQSQSQITNIPEVFYKAFEA